MLEVTFSEDDPPLFCRLRQPPDWSADEREMTVFDSVAVMRPISVELVEIRAPPPLPACEPEYM